MSDALELLENHEPAREYFVAVDSDGCAFDTMEVKHKECFIPNTIKHWDLQSVSKYARAAAEFVNLYSKWRGVNRFPALTMVFDLLADWDEVVERGVHLPEVPNLRKWIENESRLGNPALEEYCRNHDEPDMHRALAWSTGVNATVEDIVKGVAPFPRVRESLEKASAQADILVCSATPHDALQREWHEHGIDRYPFAIAGQEQGSKTQHIALAAAGKYEPERMLMIGDAPGDMRAARANKALFYPILPSEEAESWKRFHEEAFDRFVAGTYGGDYEEALVREFEALLPETPPWKRAQ